MNSDASPDRGLASRRVTGAAVVALGLGWATFAQPATTQACFGDCDGSGDVTVDEVVQLVNLALVGGVFPCVAGDANEDGQITVDDVGRALRNALLGCPSTDSVCGDGIVGVGEECDDGGICIGGASAGTACTSDEECGFSEDGVCVGGLDAFNGCATDDECRGGACVRCKTFGGDGCAANCTIETLLDYDLKPDGSTAALLGSFISLWLDLAVPTGSTKLIAGKPGADGIIPIAMRASDVDLPRILEEDPVCACVRAVISSTCGGVNFYKNGSRAPDCGVGFANPTDCSAAGLPPCAAVHGPGNTASGLVGCDGLSPNAVDFEVDCGGEVGLAPGEPVITLSEDGPPGSAFLMMGAAIGTVVGACTGTAPAYGLDGHFCTDDDSESSRGTPNIVPFVTGSATGSALNAADGNGSSVGPHSTSGVPFSCNDDGLVIHPGVNLAGVFATCDQPTLKEMVVLMNLMSE